MGDGKIHLAPLFVDMARMYPWATKEYLLWECTIGQIILYHNLGVERINGSSPDSGKDTLTNKSYEELKAIKDELKQQYGDIE